MSYIVFRYSVRTNTASKLTIPKNTSLLYNKSLDFQKPHKFFIPCQVVFYVRLILAQWLKAFRNGSVLKNLLPKQVIHNIRFLRNNLFILNISKKQTNSH